MRQRGTPATFHGVTGDALFVFAVLGATILLFASDRMRLDVVALMALLALSLTGILTPAEALAGFSDAVVIMIAGLFVVGGALFRTGVAERFGRALGRVAGTSRARLTVTVMLGAALLSAFMSSTGTVAVMLPVTATLAWGARLSPSLLLIPLSVGSLFGGLLTLIGTPPNIVVSNQLAAAGYAPFRFFDFTPVGLVVLAAGTVILAVAGGRLFPARASADGPSAAGGVASVPGEELVRGYGVGRITRLRVPPQSPLVGQSPAAARLRERYGVSVLAVRRASGPGGRRTRLAGTADTVLRVGDEMDVQAPADTVQRLLREELLHEAGVAQEPEAMLAEVLLTPRSRLIGRTLADARFRTRYGANVLSIRRQGELLEGPLASTELRFADTLLVSGSPRRIELLRGDVGDFVVVAQARDDSRADGPLSRRQYAAIAIMVGMMLLLTFEVVAPVLAVLLAAVAMVLARCLTMEVAYRSINWESVVLIAAFLPMATALQKTGGMDLFVARLETIGSAGPLAVLAALFILTGVLSQVISNTATAVLVAPVAIATAAQLGVSPYPMVMGVAVAASSAFATPVATPVNMLVLGPGAYRFGDFMKAGILLQTVALLITLLLVPLLFPF
ncbi:MAG TPA: SLC13 family permease [Longimicrobiales bacterium]|nr:SLC13 family permease [Longimicrobiales bacterium]